MGHSCDKDGNYPEYCIWGDMDARLLFKEFNVISSEIGSTDTVLYRENRDVPLCPQSRPASISGQGSGTARLALGEIPCTSHVHV